MPAPVTQFVSPWPHRLAVGLGCAIFPLLWVGGLVTTYRAGMAVPDWPNTYGYNLFLYPLSTWIVGPFRLFLEHGHRLLGAAAGCLAILVVIALWRGTRITWIRWLGAAVLVAIGIQGVIGGSRVVLDRTVLAQLHGSFGPLAFALAVALATVTSPKWLSDARESIDRTNGPRLRGWAATTAMLAYLQILLGVQLRHLTLATTWSTFRVELWFHLANAAVLYVHAYLVWRGSRKLPGREPSLVTRASLLFVLLNLQIVLGCATWVAKYNWPTWMNNWTTPYTVVADAPWQVHLTTAHVAMGSLVLATSVATFLWTLRLPAPQAAPSWARGTT